MVFEREEQVRMYLLQSNRARGVKKPYEAIPSP